jgi:hypothetical protein
MLRGCTHATPRNPSPFGAPLFSLLDIQLKRDNQTTSVLRGCTLATPRNPSPFGAPLFSLLGYYSREKMYTIIAELDTLEMSDKSIYQSQNGSRNIYTIIIHANIFSQHRRTSSAIHMERTTTRHFLSHRTTYLQYRSPYHAYSLSQQSTILS